MNKSNRFAVIMAGGKGERFWPQSRALRPKHLLPIIGMTPMLDQTIQRLKGAVPFENIFVITNREQKENILLACSDLSKEQVIGEPVGCDTAAAVALAALLIERKSPNAIIAMLPADAAIHNTANFQRVLCAGFTAAEMAPNLVTIGIRPTSPATGYGYIHKGEKMAPTGIYDIFQVQKFVEKPNLETANKYLASGEYFWNAGMFIWQTRTIRDSFLKNEPEVWSNIQRIGNLLDDGIILDKALDMEYQKIKKISVDYAILEKANNVICIPSDFDWDDVGEWPAIARHESADDTGNIQRGNIVSLDAKNNILIGEKGHLIAALGVDDLIVVQTDDATLICHKSRAQDLKKLVQKIAENPELECHL